MFFVASVRREVRVGSLKVVVCVHLMDYCCPCPSFVAFAKVQKVLDRASKPVCEREFMILMNTLPEEVSDTKNRTKMEAFQTAQKSLDVAMQKAVRWKPHTPLFLCVNLVRSSSSHGLLC